MPHRESCGGHYWGLAQLVKNPPAMWETWVRSLGWEDPLEKGMAAHFSILAWRIPWTVSSMGLQRVRHDWVTFTFTGGSVVKNLPAKQEMQETWVRSLGREDPLEEEMATPSSVLAWRIPWTEEPGGLQSMGPQRVGHDWATNPHQSRQQTCQHFVNHKGLWRVSHTRAGISVVLTQRTRVWLPGSLEPCCRPVGPRPVLRPSCFVQAAGLLLLGAVGQALSLPHRTCISAHGGWWIVSTSLVYLACMRAKSL